MWYLCRNTTIGDKKICIMKNNKISLLEFVVKGLKFKAVKLIVITLTTQCPTLCILVL